MNVKELFAWNEWYLKFKWLQRCSNHNDLLCKWRLKSLAKLASWLNGRVFVHEVSVGGFESCYSHLAILTPAITEIKKLPIYKYFFVMLLVVHEKFYKEHKIFVKNFLGKTKKWKMKEFLLIRIVKCIFWCSFSHCHPAGIFLLKVNNRNTRKRCEKCSNIWTFFTPCSSVSTVNFEHVIVDWVYSYCSRNFVQPISWNINVYSISIPAENLVLWSFRGHRNGIFVLNRIRNAPGRLSWRVCLLLIANACPEISTETFD